MTAPSYHVYPINTTIRGLYYTSVIMGNGKKEANSKVRLGKTGDGMANVKVKGENFYRYAITTPECI